MHLKRFLLLIFTLFVTLQIFGEKIERVVSLAPSITKNIYFLEAQNLLVGCTNYCTEALADDKEVVASAISVNIEKTVSLLPDLVLVTTITSPETIDMLKKFGIQVEVFSTPESFEAICDQFIRLGKLLNKEEFAKDIISNNKERIAKIKSVAILESKNNIFFQIGAEPLFTVLPHTFMNDYIRFIGGTNIAEGMTKGTITRETVLTKNPDIIFIVTMGIIGDEEKNKWSSFKGLKAAQQNKIFIIDAEKACSPTPITFVETLENIVTLLNQ